MIAILDQRNFDENASILSSIVLPWEIEELVPNSDFEIDCETAGLLTGVRFLIIEDEIAQALLLREMLSNMGGIVLDTAFGYDQARNAVHRDAFDCVILDINLNGTLSFPIAETLKGRGIPFVLCTAYADGVDAYPDASNISWVDKPVQSEELREAVLSALKAGKQ